jgi:hypothetical protein
MVAFGGYQKLQNGRYITQVKELVLLTIVVNKTSRDVILPGSESDKP